VLGCHNFAYLLSRADILLPFLTLSVSTTKFKTVSLLALVASASAFAPAPFGARASTRLHSDKVYGKYDDKLWDNEGTKIGLHSVVVLL